VCSDHGSCATRDVWGELKAAITESWVVNFAESCGKTKEKRNNPANQCITFKQVLELTLNIQRMTIGGKMAKTTQKIRN